MAKKLSRYRHKRDPGRTNEPFGAEPLRSGTGATVASTEGAFVVHQHDASRRHFDLRLEMGGVLQSFAVPKGPTLDPKQKHLAINTEDHPLEYLDFEAVIAAGNYGAGAMILWDRGAVRYLERSGEEGLARGKLDFTLHGYKLRGRFALVKVSGRKGEPEPAQSQWLLIKKTDAHAREGWLADELPRSVLSGLTIEELERADAFATEIEAEARSLGARPLAVSPDHFVPMLCAVSGAPLQRPGYVYELKVDGVRILAHRDEQNVRLRYRTGRHATESYPEVARAVRALPGRRFVLDGEIVAFDERGRPDFQRLGPRIQATRANEARRAAREIGVNYLVFDLLILGELDLRTLPLLTRKRLLSRLVQGRGVLRVLDHLENDGEPLWRFCEEQDLEGVIVKRADGPYIVGPRRSGDWVKLKRQRDDDFVVVGVCRGEGSRGELGSLDLGSYDGDHLFYRGRVGSGVSADSAARLLELLKPLHVAEPQFEGEPEPAPRGRTFVHPEVVVTVRHSGFTREGHLRHPVYCGVRADADPRACHAAPALERLEIALEEADRAHEAAPTLELGRVRLTNQDKIFWPDDGYTKGELCRYYGSIAHTLLPYLRNRPVLMTRFPDGITGKNFFQWNLPQGAPEWLHAFPIRSEDHNGREVMAILVDEPDSLLYLANLGCIVLHLLASRADDLERADFLTVDFDLGESPLSHGIELARGLGELLDQIGLKGFPKTSGQTGLHVLVALGGVPFPVAKTLAELLGRILHTRYPAISTVERMRSKRPNAVYIDTGQTGRSRAIVAPYSVRAYPGARVSTPLTWDEVSFNLDPGAFTMFTVPERIERLGDPMTELLAQTPDIEGAVAALGTLW